MTTGCSVLASAFLVAVHLWCVGNNTPEMNFPLVPRIFSTCSASIIGILVSFCWAFFSSEGKTEEVSRPRTSCRSIGHHRDPRHDEKPTQYMRCALKQNKYKSHLSVKVFLPLFHAYHVHLDRSTAVVASVWRKSSFNIFVRPFPYFS